MSELVVAMNGESISISPEERAEVDAVRELVEATGTKLFAKEHISPVLTEAQDALADAMVAELVKNAIRSELSFQYASQTVRLSHPFLLGEDEAGVKTKIEERTGEILDALSINETQNRKDALETVSEYAMGWFESKMGKSGNSRDLNAKQVSRIEELTIPFAATAILEQARVRLYELGYKKSTQHDGLEMNPPMAEALATFVSTLDSKDALFNDKKAREQALNELKIAVKQVMFDEKIAWFNNDVQAFDRKATNVAVEQYFYYRRANLRDRMMPRGADGVRHVSWSRVRGVFTVVVLLGLVGCSLYSAMTPPPDGGIIPLPTDDDDDKTPTPAWTYTPQHDPWDESSLVTSAPLADWQRPWDVSQYFRTSTDVINHDDGSVKLYLPEHGGSERYALGYSTFSSLDVSAEPAFSPTIFFGEDASEVGMLGEPIPVEGEEGALEWKVFQMNGQSVQENEAFTVIFKKMGDSFTFTIKMANGDLVPLVPESSEDASNSTPMANPTSLPVEDFNVVFTHEPQVKFVSESSPTPAIGTTEIDLKDGTKLEKQLFTDHQEALQFIAADAEWFGGGRMVALEEWKKQGRMDGITQEYDLINNLGESRGLYPPYPEYENPLFFHMIITKINGREGLLISYLSKDGSYNTIYLDDPNIHETSRDLREEIFNTIFVVPIK